MPPTDPAESGTPTVTVTTMARLLSRYLDMHDKRWALDGAFDDAPEHCECPVCVESRAVLDEFHAPGRS